MEICPCMLDYSKTIHYYPPNENHYDYIRGGKKVVIVSCARCGWIYKFVRKFERNVFNDHWGSYGISIYYKRMEVRS